jgi:glutaredoxin
MNTFLKGIVASLLVLLFACASVAQIYRWKDIDGNIVISSTPPPPGVKWEKRKLEEAREAPKTTDANAAKPAAQAPGEKRPIEDIKIVMYMTDWCPVCKEARIYLKALGVNLVEYNVDKDPQKKEEWIRKVGSRRGVPTLDIEGIILQGLYGEKILAAIEEKRAS